MIIRMNRGILCLSKEAKRMMAISFILMLVLMHLFLRAKEETRKKDPPSTRQMIHICHSQIYQEAKTQDQPIQKDQTDLLTPIGLKSPPDFLPLGKIVRRYQIIL